MSGVVRFTTMELDPIAKRYADTKYLGNQERLAKEYPERLQAKKHELAARGAILGGFAERSFIDIGLDHIRSLANARVESYLEAYERSGIAFEESDIGTIEGEILSIVYSNMPSVEKDVSITPLREQARNEAASLVVEMRRKMQLHIDGAALDGRKLHYVSPSLHALLESEYLRLEKRLSQIDTKLPIQIREAAERLDNKSSESISHCALTCRRALKAFADAVYPARTDQPKGRSLDDSHFVNRLWQFAQERMTAPSGRELVQYSLESLGWRVDVINDLVSKGVHTEFAYQEAKRCLIQAIFLLAELAEV
jgi:hypothetical protein